MSIDTEVQIGHFIEGEPNTYQQCRTSFVCSRDHNHDLHGSTAFCPVCGQKVIIATEDIEIDIDIWDYFGEHEELYEYVEPMISTYEEFRLGIVEFHEVFDVTRETKFTDDVMLFNEFDYNTWLKQLPLHIRKLIDGLFKNAKFQPRSGFIVQRY